MSEGDERKSILIRTANMSECDERKCLLIRTANILVSYLDTVTYEDLTLSEEQARAVVKITLAIKAILRDL